MNEVRGFQRRIENFACRVCQHSVIGNGYTNHCPKCLWSVHVDVNPGDRACECHGLMKPIDVTISARQKLLRHQCQTCGAERHIRLVPTDDLEALLQLMESSGRQAPKAR